MTYRRDHTSTSTRAYGRAGGGGCGSSPSWPWRGGGRRWCGILLTREKGGELAFCFVLLFFWDGAGVLWFFEGVKGEGRGWGRMGGEDVRFFGIVCEREGGYV